MEIQEKWMWRALQLASYGAGNVSPNPMVGAVIVSPDRKIIGEGWHRKYGGPHAEVEAFRNVRPEYEHLIPESTIYVTLEPCSHYGKTPPCAKLLIDKGIKRVVFGCTDPNPKVAGRGARMLEEAGIEVVKDILEQQCRDLNRRFMTAHTRHRPWIILKWAQSADGYIDGKISTPVSLITMHRERALCDAILCGTNTLLIDRPSLTTRYWPGTDPVFVALYSHRLPAGFKAAGREPIMLNPEHPLEENMNILFSKHGITSLMVEGGSQLLQSFIDHNLYDEIRIEKNRDIIHGKVKAPKLPD